MIRRGERSCGQGTKERGSPSRSASAGVLGDEQNGQWRKPGGNTRENPKPRRRLRAGREGAAPSDERHEPLHRLGVVVREKEARLRVKCGNPRLFFVREGKIEDGEVFDKGYREYASLYEPGRSFAVRFNAVF